MKISNILGVAAISIATSVLSVWSFQKFTDSEPGTIAADGKMPVNYAGFFGGENNGAGPVDFTSASTAATPAVVHINTKTKARPASNNLPRNNPFGDFFGDDMMEEFFGNPRGRSRESAASGSGVLISDDGYIVTNNHVIDGADEIDVVLANRRRYKATMVAADPSTDLAVLKIEGSKFPYILYGNSDEVKLGQWVLAIGYPLSLDVTITAGIVSAKARSLNINARQSKTPIESFIQTDAAVNPGNSGGALINTSGQLIGINSAIASPTGSYAGYSYAIPVNLVKKIVNDMIKYGAVQRGYIGISYPPDNLSPEALKASGAKEGDGVYVLDVSVDGAAISAGIRKGDFVTKINGVRISTGPELQEQVARYKPGDKIMVTILRNNKEQEVVVTLKNKSGTYSLVKKASIMEELGGSLTTIDKTVAQRNDINGGVKVTVQPTTGLLAKTKILKDFIITSVNNQEVRNLEDLEKILLTSRGIVRLEGVYDGFEGLFGYPLNLGENTK